MAEQFPPSGKGTPAPAMASTAKRDPWPCPSCAAKDAEIARLRAEVAEWCAEAFCEGGFEVAEGEPMAGWWDSCAKSSVKAAGDRLVELGLWERHPDGVGRRWFYRPKQTAPPTGA